MAVRGSRRPVLALALLGAAALCLLNLAGPSFVGLPAAGPGQERGSKVVVRTSAGYLERMSPKESDVPFDASAASGDVTEVEFKKRPFGILRYQPGSNGKGAMAMEIIPKSRYPGDPQGQAFVAGVKSGTVVKSINGQDVRGEDFGKIMDMLDDEVADPRFSKSTQLALSEQGGPLAPAAEPPLKIEFAAIPGYEYKGAELSEDSQDGFAR